MGLEETAWGKMIVMTVGSFHVFAKIVTLTGVLHVKAHVFPKTPNVLSIGRRCQLDGYSFHWQASWD